MRARTVQYITVQFFCFKYMHVYMDFFFLKSISLNQCTNLKRQPAGKDEPEITAWYCPILLMFQKYMYVFFWKWFELMYGMTKVFDVLVYGRSLQNSKRMVSRSEKRKSVWLCLWQNQLEHILYFIPCSSNLTPNIFIQFRESHPSLHEPAVFKAVLKFRTSC